MPAELPLVPSAMALAISALLFFLPGGGRAAHRLGTLFVVIAAATPIVLDPLVDPTRASGRALWEWSAIGGPTIQASYQLDALAATALTLMIAFSGVTLATVGRSERRHPALAALVLALGFVSIALVVTDDLVAAIVVLAVLGILTTLGLFAVAPAPATARAAAYLSAGLQAWILAALLVSRNGTPTFVIDALPPNAVSAGAILAATLGALLFAGLYPVVAWAITERETAGDPGRIGSLVLMPAGIGATLMLLRILGATDVDATRIPLPEIGRDVRLALAVVVLAAVAVSVARGPVPRRPLGVGLVAIAVLVAYPILSWAHTVLLAAILTAAYAAVVSLAMPEQWETVRSDLGLVALWIGIATASPLGIAGGILALLARAAAALVSAQWLVPHRDYIGFVGGSAVFIAGAIAVGIGASSAGDLPVAILGVAAALLIVALEIAQVGRRFRIVDVPADLDVASAIAASLIALLGAVLLVPIEAVVRERIPGMEALTSAPVVTMTVAAAAAVILARTVRPLLPYVEIVAERSGPAMRALDPAPIGVGAFRLTEFATTRGGAAFAAFERRGGVWLATLLIVAVLVWVAR